jgi:ATP-dependent DNA ligase
MKSGVQVAIQVAKSLARFIEPMECLPVPKLPAGQGWLYEIKLDGWRLESVKTGGKVMLYSRRGKSLNSQFPRISLKRSFRYVLTPIYPPNSSRVRAIAEVFSSWFSP